MPYANLVYIYICIYYIINPPFESAIERTTNRPTALENTAQGVLCARNHCSAVLRNHWALEITARACREATWRSKSPLEHGFSYSATPENAAPALLFRTFRSSFRFGQSLFGRASKQSSPRNRGSSKRSWIRQHFRISCGIPFEIALLRTLHCFELCLVRLHRHRQVLYANLVYGCWRTGFRHRLGPTKPRANLVLTLCRRGV